MSDTEELSFVLKLRDEVSAAAGHAHESVSEVSQALGAVGKQAEKVEGSAHKAGGGLTELGGSASGLGLEIGAMAGIAEEAVGIVAELGRKVIDAGLEFAKTAIEASTFRKAMEGSLSVFEGGRAEAAETFDAIQDMATGFGVADDQATKMYRNLRATGIEAGQAKDALKAAFDLRAIRGGGADGDQAAQTLLDTIERVKAIGRVGDRELAGLARDAGLKPDLIIAEIAKSRGVSVAMAKELFSKQKVTSDESIKAIMAAVHDTTGKGLGEAAKDFADHDLTSQAQRAKNVWGNLFEHVDTSGLSKFGKAISDSLGGESGKRLELLFDRSIGHVFDLFGKLADDGTIDKTIKLLIKAGEKADVLFTNAAPYVEEFADIFDKTLAPGLAKVKPLFDSLDFKEKAPNKATLEEFRLLGEWLAGSVAELAAVVGAVIWLENEVDVGFNFIGKHIADWWREAKGLFDGIPTDMREFGHHLVSGFLEGIKEMLPHVSGALGASGLAGEAVKAVSEHLKIHSPSRVMADLGEFTAEGFVQGLDVPDVSGAAADMVSPLQAPDVSGPTVHNFLQQGNAKGGEAGAGGGGIQISLGPITIEANEHTDGAKVAQDFASELMVHLPAAFEKLASEMGVAA